VDVAHDTDLVPRLVFPAGSWLVVGCQVDAVTVGGDVRPWGDWAAPAPVGGMATTAIDVNTSAKLAMTAPANPRRKAPLRFPTLATS